MKNAIVGIIFSFFFMFQALGDGVELEVNPPNPVKNETFQLIFKIKSSKNERPFISFDPSHAEVLSRSSGGVSISTTIINGKVSTSREQTYTYDIVSGRVGLLLIRDVKVTLGSKEYKIKNVKVKISSHRKAGRKFFARAEISKSNPFLGEGIDVNYYLYFSVMENVVNHEVLKFPKLDDFLKRFHMPKSNIETMEVNGFMYKRKLIYSARLYPEKTGDRRIDPVKIRIQYQSRRSRQGLFGFGFRNYQVKDLSTPSVKVHVRALPTKNVPKDFTGLIGDHNFKLDSNRNKYLVNEAIELKLIVEGGGALENFSSPVLYRSEQLEDFDTKESFEEVGLRSGRKIFEYTYLPRSSLTFASKAITFSLFDPEKEVYFSKVLELPALIVSGRASSGTSSLENNVSDSNLKSNERITEDIKDKFPLSGLISPNFKIQEVKPRWIAFFNSLIGIFIFILLFEISYDSFLQKRLDPTIRELSDSLKKGNLEYSNLYKLILHLKNQSVEKEQSIQEIIRGSQLSHEAKNYFQSALELCENASFNKESSGGDGFSYKDKHFKELYRKIKNNLNKNGNDKRLS